MSFDAHILTAPTAHTPPDGEAAPNAEAAAREARRMARLYALERLRARAERIADKLCDLIEGTLTPEEQEPFARIADPTLAFTRVATAIRRIAALEEQIDEDAEERAERQAAEAAKRAREAAAQEVASLPADRKIHLRASRRVVHDAIHAAIDARGTLDDFQHGSLLADLVGDLDLPDYADDPELVIAQIETELDAILGRPPDRDVTTVAVQSETPPRIARSSLESQAADVYAALQRASEALGLARGHADTG